MTSSTSATDFRVSCVAHLRTNLGEKYSTLLHYTGEMAYFKQNTSQYEVSVRFSCLQSNCT